jgi:hypothetical protein
MSCRGDAPGSTARNDCLGEPWSHPLQSGYYRATGRAEFRAYPKMRGEDCEGPGVEGAATRETRTAGPGALPPAAPDPASKEPRQAGVAWRGTWRIPATRRCPGRCVNAGRRDALLRRFSAVKGLVVIELKTGRFLPEYVGKRRRASPRTPQRNHRHPHLRHQERPQRPVQPRPLHLAHGRRRLHLRQTPPTPDRGRPGMLARSVACLWMLPLGAE